MLVARSDLGMGRGKQAAQVAHAAVAAVLATARSRDFRVWLQEGQPKVVLRAELIRDAGRTQLDPGTLTCCAIGPADSDKIDAVTGTLSLL